MRALGLLLPLVLIAPFGAVLPASGRALVAAPEPMPYPYLMPPDPLLGGWPSSAVLRTPDPPRPAATTGTLQLLVLMVEFTNRSHDPSHDAAHFDLLFNDAGPGAASVRAYYAAASYGALTVNATIVPMWFASNRTMQFYGQDGATGIDNANGPVYGLVSDVVRAADPVVDFSAFDADADGSVDHLIVVHAGLAQDERANETDLIWSHTWAVLDADPGLPGTQALIADGVQVYAYTMVSEASPLGVVAHEFGHQLGLPDLYDTDRSSDGAGIWDLMAEGAWTGAPSGSIPSGLSAWSKIRLGWLSATDAGTRLVGATIPALETTPFAYRLPSSSSSTEYFLLENREPIGFDAGLPTSGLLVWHVDDAQPNNDVDNHRRLDLVEADEGLNGDHPTDGGDPWHDSSAGWGPDTSPSSAAYDGTRTKWQVRDISAQGPTMTASILRDIVFDLAVSEIRVPSMVAVGSSVTATITVVNQGSVPAAAVLTTRVYRDRIDPADIVWENVSGLSVNVATVSRVNVTFNATSLARYLIDARTSLPGDEIAMNDERVAHVATNVFAFHDGMEGGGTWTVNGTAQDPYRWSIVNATDPNGSAREGVRAWRFGFVPTASPNPMPPAWHTLTSPSVGATGPTYLTFYHRFDLAGRAAPPSGSGGNGTDRGSVEVRYDNRSWSTVATFAWRDLEWAGVSIDVSPPPGATTIQVRFNATAAAMPSRGGWWVDDVGLGVRGLSRGVAVLPTTVHIAGSIGSVAAAAVKIVNVGDYKEAFWLNASGPLGWIVQLQPPGAGLALAASVSIVLAPDRDASFVLLALVPLDAAGGRSYTVDVAATAAVGANATAGAVVTIDVPAGPEGGGFVLVAAVAAGLAGITALLGFLLWRRPRVPRT